MTRDKPSTKRAKRTPVRRTATGAVAARPGRSGATRRIRRRGARGLAVFGAKEYQYANSRLLPRLRLEALELNASRTLALFLAATMMALLVWFFADERFYVYTAQIQGNSLVTADEVYRAGGLHAMSIFYIDRQKVAQGIASGIAGVTQVRVQCRLPARVSVRIYEQDVRYLWRRADASFLVDGEGHILKADDGTHAGLLVIQDLDNQPVQPGGKVDVVALTAVGRLHGILPEVQVFEYSRDRGVSLSDARGWRVYFGDDQQLTEKVATLQALLDKLTRENQSVRVIDLRFVASPYYQ
jgi:cell division septal protein FtsQ